MKAKAVGTRKLHPTSNSTTYAAPALEKGLDVLELLAGERDGLTKSAIARALNRTVSEIFRMLLCLQQRGYIVEVSQERYALSLRLFQMAHEHPPTERLLAEALPRMQQLAQLSHQSCHLGVLDAARVVILAQANAPTPVGLFVKTGSSVDLMEAATGQVILAHLPAEEQAQVLKAWGSELNRPIPADFVKRLRRIQQRGFETKASYQLRGVTNLSRPIMGRDGRAIAALTIPFIRHLPAEPVSLEVAHALLLQACRSISTAMGVQNS